MNPENKCSDLEIPEIKTLPATDSLKQLLAMQTSLQERVDKLDEYKNSDMYGKCREIIYNAHCFQAEIQELLDRMPWKAWKNYTEEQLKDWTSEEQKVETFFEAIDALHFALNIFIILDMSAEEIVAYYKAKNKENFDRQNRNY